MLEPVTTQSETLEILEENDDNSNSNEKNLAKNEEKIKETPSSSINNFLNERKCPECNFEFAKVRDLFQHLIGKKYAFEK